MNVTFACPHCSRAARVEVAQYDGAILCPHCGVSIESSSDAVDEEGLQRCLVCPSEDLFIRKDFPQRLGVFLVVLGIVGSSIAWGRGQIVLTFAILFATALIDVVLYLCVGNQLTCYRCQAQYRGTPNLEKHASFDLETHEKHRQMQARLEGTHGP